MTQPKRANDLNTVPCWKVRVCLKGGGMLHFLAKTEPVVVRDGAALMDVRMDCITDTEHGDALGFIDWTSVSAVTWRYAPLAL